VLGGIEASPVVFAELKSGKGVHVWHVSGVAELGISRCDWAWFSGPWGVLGGIEASPVVFAELKSGKGVHVWHVSGVAELGINRCDWAWFSGPHVGLSIGVCFSVGGIVGGLPKRLHRCEWGGHGGCSRSFGLDELQVDLDGKLDEMR